MDFRIADTFTDSLARLSGDEQKAAKTTAFDLQLNPANPGMSFHKLDKAKDKNFWSVRVSSDIRLIVHKTQGSLLLCYVDHHDKAYQWAERRKLETHPKTGAAQLVEIRETVKEVLVPMYVQHELPPRPKAALFADVADDVLLGYGVPAEWLEDVKQANEDTLLAVADHLPGEAAEALLELATGGKPRVPGPAPAPATPFDHPDAQRRFRVMSDVDELQRALDAPWDKWTIFLHPAQRQWVEREYNGPARVSGSAGTGKTIVALHRAVFLARKHPNARVLLTTFSEPLASALRVRLKRLVSNEPRLAERLEVHAIDAIGQRLYKLHCHTPNIATPANICEVLKQAAQQVAGHKFGLAFLLSEWGEVVDAWQVKEWEGYRDIARLGRKTRLPEPQRAVLWQIFERARAALAARGLITNAALFTELASAVVQLKQPPFDFAVVDESQDLTIAHVRFLAAMGNGRPDGLFFAGDLGQRIFQQPFSWLAQGVDIRGRSRTLRVNYRTSHQIRQQADRLLGPAIVDLDGNNEVRTDTVSVFNGPAPTIVEFRSEAEEIEAVANWLTGHVGAGIPEQELGVFVRSSEQITRAEQALRRAGMPFKILDKQVETASGHVAISTMHFAKGLEFRAVAVMACDDDVIPSQDRIEIVGDDADLREIYDTERNLLYVACTRAREHLHISSVAPASEFLDDLKNRRSHL